MIRYAYNLSDEVKSLFKADKLIQVAMANKSAANGKWYHHRNKTPGTWLFHNVTVNPLSDTLFELKRNNVTIAVLEKSNQGVEWRHYTGRSKESATSIRVLVEGDPNVDLFYANPGVEIITETKETNAGLVATATIKNITILNGIPWQEIKNNVDIQGIGVNWFLRNVSDLDYIQGGFIANGNVTDLNRGSGRRSFCKISTDPDIPRTTDFKTDSELHDYKADYVLSPRDLMSNHREVLSMTIYHGLKQTIFPLTLPINSIF